MRPHKSRTCAFNMPMNEGQGHPHDSSGYGNNGTNSNATWASGDYGRAMSFNGLNASINCGNTASLNITGDITVSAWIKTTDINIALFQKYGGSPSYYGYGLFLDTAGKLRFYTDSITWVESNNDVDDDIWHYVAVTGIGTSGTFYIDGSPDGTFTYGAPTDNLSEILYIGSNNGTASWYDGLLNNALIFNRGWSSTEILNSWNATKSRYGR